MIREERRKKRRRKHILIGFLTTLLILALAALIVIKVFTVKNVEVEGNKLYSDEQIKEWVLNDDYSWNTLYVYFKYRFFDTQEVPFIDTMEVSVKSPHTLHVEVYEKGLLGYLYMDSLGQNVYFDKDGFVVEMSTDVIEGVPQITGLTCGDAVLYEKLDVSGKDTLKDLLAVTQTLKKYNLVPDTINYDDQGNVTLQYGTITVNLGQATSLTEKVVRMEKLCQIWKDLQAFFIWKTGQKIPQILLLKRQRNFFKKTENIG